MRILMIAHTYYLRDPRVRREAEALTEAGHAVEVLCLREEGESSHEMRVGVSIHRVPVRRRRGGALRYLLEYVAFTLLAAAWVSRRTMRRRYDIVHVHNMPNFLVLAAALPKALGAKVVLDVHDPMPEILTSEPALAGRTLVRRALELEEDISVRLADYLLTVSEPMRERLIARGAKPEQVGVVMNFPDPSLFPRLPRPESNGTEKRFTLVYTGTISERYGLEVAIRGVDLLRGESPRPRLLIAGDGPDVPRLRQLADELDLGDSVEFLGSVELDKLAELRAGADAGIACHHDGPFGALHFSTKVMEYLYGGLPVICARTRTIAHYLDESALFFFAPGSVAGFVEQARLVRDRPDLVAEKNASAQVCLAALDWRIEKRKLVELIPAVAGNASHAAR